MAIGVSNVWNVAIVRNEILKYLLVSPEPLYTILDVIQTPVQHWFQWEPTGVRQLGLDPTILRTCRDVWKEGTQLLYQHNRLRIFVMIDEYIGVKVRVLEDNLTLNWNRFDCTEAVQRKNVTVRGIIQRFADIEIQLRVGTCQSVSPRQVAYQLAPLCAWLNSPKRLQRLLIVADHFSYHQAFGLNSMKMLRCEDFDIHGMCPAFKAELQWVIESHDKVYDIVAKLEYMRYSGIAKLVDEEAFDYVTQQLEELVTTGNLEAVPALEVYLNQAIARKQEQLVLGFSKASSHPLQPIPRH